MPVIHPRMKSRDAAELKLKEAEMAGAIAAQRRQVEYRRIKLKLGHELDIAGIQIGKAYLASQKGPNGIKVPLMGTPHAGGIDVEVFTAHVIGGKKVPTRSVITVPWASILQADHEPEQIDETA